jgi:hypothetical protein
MNCPFDKVPLREKLACHSLVAAEIKAGRLTAQPCEVCGKLPIKGSHGKRQVFAHHEDYEKPLTVRWFCQRHHLDHHSRIKAALHLELLAVFTQKVG